jgi:hypothetical protein
VAELDVRQVGEAEVVDDLARDADVDRVVEEDPVRRAPPGAERQSTLTSGPSR